MYQTVRGYWVGAETFDSKKYIHNSIFARSIDSLKDSSKELSTDSRKDSITTSTNNSLSTNID
jgi:hypothetical protein